MFAHERSKITDLRAASTQGSDPSPWPSDPDYSPPECLYGFGLATEWDQKRAQDLYLFGSLILFLFMETNTTPMLLLKMARTHHPHVNGDSFETALPYLQEAFDSVCEELADEPDVPELLVQCYRELCNPDPRLRGHQGAGRYQDRYALDRYISRFDRLEKQARYTFEAQAAA